MTSTEDISAADSPADDSPTPVEIAIRGREVTGLSIFNRTSSEDDIQESRVMELITEMTSDVPTGGTNFVYGKDPAHHLHFWKGNSTKPPLIVFVHGGSWRAGTHLDYIGSRKVSHLTSKGYAFATVNFRLVPVVTVEEQVQDVADAVAYLVKIAADLDFDSTRIVLMGHSSGAHVVTLLGTDTSYLDRAGISIDIITGVISLDGSNYNALAEITDSPGNVAQNLISALGTDPGRLRAMSPTWHAAAPNAQNFLLLHVMRQGDVRQAVELSAALSAAGTNNALHVFKGEGFEGHVQMLLRLGDKAYPATEVLDRWLVQYIPVI